MKCLLHNWYYFPKVSKTNGTMRYCKKCGKHQYRAYFGIKWDTLYSFNFISSIEVNFLDAINLALKQTKTYKELFRRRSNGELCLWYKIQNLACKKHKEKLDEIILSNYSSSKLYSLLYQVENICKECKK